MHAACCCWWWQKGWVHPTPQKVKFYWSPTAQLLQESAASPLQGPRYSRDYVAQLAPFPKDFVPTSIPCRIITKRSDHFEVYLFGPRPSLPPWLGDFRSSFSLVASRQQKPRRQPALVQSGLPQYSQPLLRMSICSSTLSCKDSSRCPG